MQRTWNSCLHLAGVGLSRFSEHLLPLSIWLILSALLALSGPLLRFCFVFSFNIDIEDIFKLSLDFTQNP